MRWLAATVAFVGAYFVATLGIAELSPRAIADYLYRRPTLLAVIMLAICVAAASATSWAWR